MSHVLQDQSREQDCDAGLPWKVVVESLPHVMWINAPDGETLYVNDVGFEVAGLDLKAASQLGWLDLVHPDDAERALVDHVAAVSAGVAAEGEYRLRIASGAYRWMSVRSVPVSDASGVVEAWIGTWSDIDDLKRAEEELRTANHRLADAVATLEALQAAAPIGIGMVDRSYRVVHLNHVLSDLNGTTPADAVGQRLPDMLGDRWDDIRQLYDQVLATGEPMVNAEIHRITAAGRASDWLASYYPIHVEGELTGVGVVALDVTDRRAEEQLRSIVMDHMAEGLYAVDDRGDATYVNAAAARMFGWTQDELLGKPMHDTVHHQRLDGSPRPESDCPLLHVRAAGEAVRVDHDAFTRRDGTIFPVAYSSAPLRAGGRSTGAVVVFRDISEENDERARLEKELAALSWVGRIRDAIDEDRLVLHAQPIVPATGGLPTEELLVRMVGHNGELIGPAAFLPAAERYGLIRDIDRWVIGKAIRRAATGRRVEVNLSGASVASADIADFIERELRDSGADPANVVFEITETALIGDMAAGEMFARRLAELGCQLALDDFGTGYGSFTYLKRLPVNYLKIDIEFVTDILTNPANQHVVRAIISLAKAFDLKTVAEGVEDAATWDYVRGEGVDFGQGFYLGRPAPTCDGAVDAAETPQQMVES